MGVVSPRAFAAALGDLDRAEVTEFVRDLLAARGDDVAVAGDGVLVATRGTRERRVFVHQPSGFGRRSATPPDDIDVIVTRSRASDRARELAGDYDAAVLDADDLHGLLCYGIDRERADGIALAYLGRPLSMPGRSDGRNPASHPGAGFLRRVADRFRRGEADDPREAGEWRTEGGRRKRGGRWRGIDRWGVSGRWRDVSRWRWGVVALLVALVVVGAFGGGVPSGIGGAGGTGGIGVPSGEGAGGASGSFPGGDSVTVAGDVSVTPAPAATAGPSLEPTNETLGALPPGLGKDGITDADALARAHEAALGNRSYRWVVTYTERVDGRTVARTREIVTFERPGVYSVAVTQEGDPSGEATLFSSGPAYADGEKRYEPIRVSGSREDVRVMDLPVTDERRFRERAGTYVEWYLSASRSAITDVVTRDGATRYRVETIGDPYPGAENARGNATIDTGGMVRELRTERDVARSDVTVVLTFRYTDVGNATVEPPAWYRRNETNGTNGTAETIGTAETVGTTTTVPDREATTPGTVRTTPEVARTTADGAYTTTGTTVLDTNGPGTDTESD